MGTAKEELVMAPRDKHNVYITPDTDDNWHRWGQLVVGWITNTVPEPTVVGSDGITNPPPTSGLWKEVLDRGIQAKIVGNPNRKVKIQPYPADLFIPLPIRTMYDIDLAQIQGAPASRPYPLPSFYDRIYNGTRRNLSQAEREYIMACRIGEYVINECM